MPTYPDQEIMLLNFDSYFELMEKRGIKVFRLRRTQTFEKTREIELIVSNEHTWSYGDNLRKLSNFYYSDAKYWWVLGFVNKKPTDAHFKIGDVLLVPENPQSVIGALRE